MSGHLQTAQCEHFTINVAVQQCGGAGHGLGVGLSETVQQLRMSRVFRVLSPSFNIREIKDLLDELDTGRAPSYQPAAST